MTAADDAIRALQARRRDRRKAVAPPRQRAGVVARLAGAAHLGPHRIDRARGRDADLAGQRACSDCPSQRIVPRASSTYSRGIASISAWVSSAKRGQSAEYAQQAPHAWQMLGRLTLFLVELFQHRDAAGLFGRRPLRSRRLRSRPPRLRLPSRPSATPGASASFRCPWLPRSALSDRTRCAAGRRVRRAAARALG